MAGYNQHSSAARLSFEKMLHAFVSNPIRGILARVTLHPTKLGQLPAKTSIDLLQDLFAFLSWQFGERQSEVSAPGLTKPSEREKHQPAQSGPECTDNRAW